MTVWVGTLDRPAAFAPQVHGYRSTKRDWLVLDEPAESLARLRAIETGREAS